MNIACFDIGGTFIKYAVMSSKGEILFKDKFPSPHENCRETIPEAVVEKIEKLKLHFKLDAVGISTAGQVDSDRGEILFATDNLPDYTGAKLSEVIEGRTGLKAYAENDVNAAAIGEMWMGAARNVNTFVCITLGTGIGGAIVIDGKLYRGVKGGAGEVGHIIINENGEPCTCGCRGCLERYASTSALLRMYERDGGTEAGSTSGEEIMKRVHDGDKLACSVYNKFLDHLAVGLASITHILDPGLIIIGGGISAQGDFFIDEINARFKKAAVKSHAEHTRIVGAQLKGDAAIYGACCIALQGQTESL